MRVLYFNNVCGIGGFYNCLPTDIKNDFLSDVFYECPKCFDDITDFFSSEEIQSWYDCISVIVIDKRVYMFEGTTEKRNIARTNEKIIELFNFYMYFSNYNSMNHKDLIIKEITPGNKVHIAEWDDGSETIEEYK
jgi:hypothetical protein